MELTHEFDIDAPPDDVFDFLLDAPAVATCVPGVVIDEIVDETTFKGTLKVKVGPVTVRYRGNGYIQAADKDRRVATIRAEGEEQGASGSVTATMQMSVAEAGRSSRVTILTDLAIAGRVATMGRGVIEQVGTQLVGQASRKIETRILAPSEANISSATTDTGPAVATAAAPPASEDAESSLAVGALIRGLVSSWLRKSLSRALFNVERFAARTRERIDA
jgi:carbon monoxide dehydrogenase subunit G